MLNAGDILKEMYNKITMGDVFTLYEAIGFIEANATENSKNLLYSLKNVAYKVNCHLSQEENEAIKQAIKERQEEVKDE